MVAAIGSSAAAYAGSPPSFTGLQAQLQRYQQQLSDCVNCATAKTPEGKSDIQEIAARIHQLRQRIAQTGSQPGSSTVAPLAKGPLGTTIDVFA